MEWGNSLNTYDKDEIEESSGSLGSYDVQGLHNYSVVPPDEFVPDNIIQEEPKEEVKRRDIQDINPEVDEVKFPVPQVPTVSATPNPVPQVPTVDSQTYPDPHFSTSNSPTLNSSFNLPEETKSNPTTTKIPETSIQASDQLSTLDNKIEQLEEQVEKLTTPQTIPLDGSDRYSSLVPELPVPEVTDLQKGAEAFETMFGSERTIEADARFMAPRGGPATMDISKVLTNLVDLTTETTQDIAPPFGHQITPKPTFAQVPVPPDYPEVKQTELSSPSYPVPESKNYDNIIPQVKTGYSFETQTPEIGEQSGYEFTPPDLTMGDEGTQTSPTPEIPTTQTNLSLNPSFPQYQTTEQPQLQTPQYKALTQEPTGPMFLSVVSPTPNQPSDYVSGSPLPNMGYTPATKMLAYQKSGFYDPAEYYAEEAATIQPKLSLPRRPQDVSVPQEYPTPQSEVEVPDYSEYLETEDDFEKFIANHNADVYNDPDLNFGSYGIAGGAF